MLLLTQLADKNGCTMRQHMIENRNSSKNIALTVPFAFFQASIK